MIIILVISHFYINSGQNKRYRINCTQIRSINSTTVCTVIEIGFRVLYSNQELQNTSHGFNLIVQLISVGTKTRKTFRNFIKSLNCFICFVYVCTRTVCLTITFDLSSSEILLGRVNVHENTTVSPVEIHLGLITFSRLECLWHFTHPLAPGEWFFDTATGRHPDRGRVTFCLKPDWQASNLLNTIWRLLARGAKWLAGHNDNLDNYTDLKAIFV